MLTRSDGGVDISPIAVEPPHRGQPSRQPSAAAAVPRLGGTAHATRLPDVGVAVGVVVGLPHPIGALALALHAQMLARG